MIVYVFTGKMSVRFLLVLLPALLLAFAAPTALSSPDAHAQSSLYVLAAPECSIEYENAESENCLCDMKCVYEADCTDIEECSDQQKCSKVNDRRCNFAWVLDDHGNKVWKEDPTSCTDFWVTSCETVPDCKTEQKCVNVKKCQHFSNCTKADVKVAKRIQASAAAVCDVEYEMRTQTNIFYEEECTFETICHYEDVCPETQKCEKVNEPMCVEAWVLDNHGNKVWKKDPKQCSDFWVTKCEWVKECKKVQQCMDVPKCRPKTKCADVHLRVPQQVCKCPQQQQQPEPSPQQVHE